MSTSTRGGHLNKMYKEIKEIILFPCMVCCLLMSLKNILCLLRVKTQDVFLTSFERYECLKDVSETSFVY